jgi:hypothetical protein
MGTSARGERFGRNAMTKILTAACAGALLTAVTGATARGAANVGIIPAKDNTLIQTGATTDLSNGGGPLFVGEVGLNGGSTFRRALMQFPVASNLPVGSWVHTASLTVTCSNSALESTDVSLYRVLSDWGEGVDPGTGNQSFSFGGSGALPVAGDATWNYRFYNTATWSNPGGDFATTPAATTTMSFEAAYTWLSNDVAVDVQNFLDKPAQNFGWMLKGSETTAKSAKKIESRESSIAANRPTLHINYTMGGDANDDNVVNLTDFTFLAQNFNQTGRTFAQGDFSRDGKVDLTDFTILAANFNRTVASTESALGAAVPEPATLGSLALAATALLSRRRA